MISKKLLMAIVDSCFVLNNSVAADTVASCGELNGYTLYHDAKAKSGKDNGFERDKISNAKFTFKKLDDGSYDILYFDARKRISSLKQDGGEVQLFRSSDHEMAFVHTNKGVVEIYSVYQVADKGVYLDLIVSRGIGAMFEKSALLTGRCDSFELK